MQLDALLAVVCSFCYNLYQHGFKPAFDWTQPLSMCLTGHVFTRVDTITLALQQSHLVQAVVAPLPVLTADAELHAGGAAAAAVRLPAALPLPPHVLQPRQRRRPARTCSSDADECDSFTEAGHSRSSAPCIREACQGPELLSSIERRCR